MKRLLALILTACLLLSLAPAVTASGDGEGWSYRYRGDHADPLLTVSVYDAKTGDFTLRGFEEDYDPNTYEPIYPYTVPEEKTGDYWVHTSLLSAGEVFPQGGEFYAVLKRQDLDNEQIVIHPLTSEEIANGLTVTETMFSSLAELTFLLGEQSNGASSNAASNYTLVWQSTQLSKSFVDVSELFQLRGDTTIFCTPGYFTAARVCSFMDYSGLDFTDIDFDNINFDDFDFSSMMPVYTAPSIVDIIQGSVSGSRIFRFQRICQRRKAAVYTRAGGGGDDLRHFCHHGRRFRSERARRELLYRARRLRYLRGDLFRLDLRWEAGGLLDVFQSGRRLELGGPAPHLRRPFGF